MAAGRAAILGALVGAGLGFAAGAAWVGSGDARRGPVAAADADALGPADPAQAPRAAGADATDPTEVARLEAEVARLREALAAQPTPAEAGQDPEAADAAEEEEAEDFFDGDALVAAGWRAADVDRLRERWEAYELDRLYLKDQAMREGWRRSGRYMREVRDLRDELRDELGDADFDAALYAAGRNNRVRIQNLLGDSPAAAAGLRVGDDIVRYAGERIFDPMRLVRLTADGAPGRPVEMRVLRGGQEVRVFLPRGPLGVRLERVSAPPE